LIKKFDFILDEFGELEKPPNELFYIGNTELIEKRKISIVGTRKPNQYTKDMIGILSKKLSNQDIVIVSGVAIGVDAIAHENAGDNTIAVVANGLDIKYPKCNSKLIERIENKSLIISSYKEKETAKRYHFLERNQLVVALGEILIIGEAELRSGSIASANIAKKLNKQIYVLPHRINQSQGTNQLLSNNEAKAIYDIDEFCESLGLQKLKKDELISYIKLNPSLPNAISKFGNKIYEYELQGKIKIIGNRCIEV